jgi:hypothetical protein
MAGRGEIRAAEWLFPAVLALIMVALGTLPYVYAYSLQDEQLRFMGRLDRDPQDMNVHRMLSKQAQEGRILFGNRMTSDELPRTYFNLEWWLEGSAERWTGLSTDAVFHLGRVLSVLYLAFAAYALCAVCLDTVNQRRFAAALICFGSGLGWAVWLHAHLADYPMTLMTYTVRGITLPLPPDVHGISVFHKSFSKPHTVRVLGSAMLFGALLIQGARSGRLRWFVLAGLVLALRFVLRPYELPESFVLLAAIPTVLMLREGRFSWKKYLPYALAGAIAVPQALFYVYVALKEPLGGLLQ